MSNETQNEIKKLQEENTRLKAVLSKVKIVKEFSDYFRNKESDTAKVYKNISETAKHIESKHSDILDAIKTQNDNKLITITKFNELVATALKEHLNL